LPITAYSSGPRLNGAFLWPSNVATQDIAPLFDEWWSLGITTVITSESRIKAPASQDGITCNSTTYGWTGGAMPGLLGTILTEASARHMSVYIGTTFSSGACTAYETSPNPAQDAVEVDTLVRLVLSSWGTLPALRGWYLTDEPALAYHTPAHISTIAPYYATQVRAIRHLDNRPILVAPYLGGAYTSEDSTVQTPAQVASKALQFLQLTGINIEVWQESVGDGTTALDPTGPKPYTVADYLGAIVGTLGSERVWSDNELFIGVGEAPGAIDRIVRQNEESDAVGIRTCWLPQHNMSAVFPQRQTGAPALLASYRSYYGL
jgi:hypothetical protein